MQIKTEQGFTCDIPAEALDNYELLEDLVDLEEGRMDKLVSVGRRLLQGGDYDRLKDFCRDKNGKVSTKVMFRQFEEIIRKIPDVSAQAKK